LNRKINLFWIRAGEKEVLESGSSGIISVLDNKRLVFVVMVLKFGGPFDIWLGREGAVGRAELQRFDPSG
jgi:hypothetical protein